MVSGKDVLAVYLLSVYAILEYLIAIVVGGGPGDIPDVQFIVIGVQLGTVIGSAQVFHVSKFVQVVSEVLLMTLGLLRKGK